MSYYTDQIPQSTPMGYYQPPSQVPNPTPTQKIFIQSPCCRSVCDGDISTSCNPATRCYRTTCQVDPPVALCCHII